MTRRRAVIYPRAGGRGACSASRTEVALQASVYRGPNSRGRWRRPDLSLRAVYFYFKLKTLSDAECNSLCKNRHNDDHPSNGVGFWQWHTRLWRSTPAQDGCTTAGRAARWGTPARAGHTETLYGKRGAQVDGRRHTHIHTRAHMRPCTQLQLCAQVWRRASRGR